jgi:hypothetical protein
MTPNRRVSDLADLLLGVSAGIALRRPEAARPISTAHGSVVVGPLDAVLFPSSQKCCSTQCGRRLSAESGKRYLGKNDPRRTAPTCVQLDERFCEAMKLAGYVMTGPVQIPCTDHPLDLTLCATGRSGGLCDGAIDDVTCA